jgi:hypothetical protein
MKGTKFTADSQNSNLVYFVLVQILRGPRK